MTGCLRRAALGLAVLALAPTGCSPDTVRVRGKLIKDGNPMVVSKDTYVTLSFIPEKPPADGEKSYSAKFDQETGSYTVELPPGKYRTMLVIALPNKTPGKLNAPTPPIKSDKAYDLGKSQELNIEVPGK
jgi:hypothetical protein